MTEQERRWPMDGERTNGTEAANGANESLDDDRDEGKERNQWHGAFYEALRLELHAYRDVLHFENEYRLSREALRMDVLVIKKDGDAVIDKNIGRVFRTHNVFEYKSEEVRPEALTQQCGKKTNKM